MMSKEMPSDPSRPDDWPAGDHVLTACPYCGHKSTQQLAIVREEKMNSRDAYCDGCGAGYHIEARAGYVTAHKTNVHRTPRGLESVIDASTPLPPAG